MICDLVWINESQVQNFYYVGENIRNCIVGSYFFNYVEFKKEGNRVNILDIWFLAYYLSFWRQLSLRLNLFIDFL